MDKDTWPGMDKNTYHREGYLYQNRYKYYPALSARRQGQRHIRREPLILHGSRRKGGRGKKITFLKINNVLKNLKNLLTF